MMVGLTLSVILGLGIAASLIAALLIYEDRLDGWDRLFISGFAGSMVMTTPGLFLNTPFDAWAYVVARAFLAGILIKRYGIPVVWAWAGDHRQRDQTRQSSLRNTDRMRDRMRDKL